MTLRVAPILRPACGAMPLVMPVPAPSRVRDDRTDDFHSSRSGFAGRQDAAARMSVSV